MKLTADGCCAEPQWLPDSRGVIYYGYGGAGGQELGTWTVGIDGGPSQPYGTRYGAFSPDRSIVAFREGGVTKVGRPDGTVFGSLATGEALLQIAPTGDRIAWLVPDPTLPRVSSSLEPPARVAVATIGPGTVGPIRLLPPVLRAETFDWFPDGRRIALGGRDAAGDTGGVMVLDTETGQLATIVPGLFLESVQVDPRGAFIAYTAVLQPQASQNGVWIVGVDGTNRRKIDVTGGYRWLPDGQALAFIPAPASGPTDELWIYTVTTGSKRTVVSAAQARFLVAGSDWALAPNGAAIVYRSALDGAIWSLRFTP